MNINTKSRNKSIHLYNPKEEGLGLYDINYINAYKKYKNSRNQPKVEIKERYAA